MQLVGSLHRYLKREGFRPGWKGAFINPFYIVRRGLFVRIRAIAPEVGGRVLDLGCGSKPYETLFSSASEYVGVDVEQAGHNHANSKVDVFYDGRRLPFADASFDAVVSFETLEHVFNLDEVLDELARVVKPGGTLLVTLPFAWGEHEQPHDCARYTSFGIKAKLAEHGFHTTELHKSGTFVEALAQLWAAYLHLHLAPRWKPAAMAFQLAVIAPVTLSGLVLARILPRRDDFFCNLVIRAERPAAAP